ncbi:MAG: sulfotransferase [Candidatus Electrothrix sp. Rat3]|nr:sulfotransferase [Candidatus Electrothrix rattekaaiensis]
MNINGLVKKVPIKILWQILRVFRFTTRWYEQIEVEYYTKLTDHNLSHEKHQLIPIEELAPVFVLSTGRCGTQTMSALAELISDVDSHHEPEPTLLEESYLYFMQLCPETPNDFWQQLLGANRDELIRQAARSEKKYFETNNRMALLCDLLVKYYPGAKFIHLVRHPCDFVRSGMRRDYYKNHPWDFVRMSPQQDDPASAGWKESSQLEKCSWLWAKTNSHINRVLETIAEERKLFVRSEDIFNNVGSTVENVLSFISTDHTPDSKKIENVLGMKLNQQTHGIYPTWKEWPEEEAQILQHHCGELMKKYSYDL